MELQSIRETYRAPRSGLLVSLQSFSILIFIRKMFLIRPDVNFLNATTDLLFRSNSMELNSRKTCFNRALVSSSVFG